MQKSAGVGAGHQEPSECVVHCADHLSWLIPDTAADKSVGNACVHVCCTVEKPGTGWKGRGRLWPTTGRPGTARDGLQRHGALAFLVNILMSST